MHAKKLNSIVLLSILALWGLVTALKFGVLGYNFDSLIPRSAYDVTITTSAQAHGADLSITHFLPLSGLGQRLENESIEAPDASYSIENAGKNRTIRYRFTQAFGPVRTRYSFRVRPREVAYSLPEFISYPPVAPKRFDTYLQATKSIQKNDSVIVEKARDLGLTTDRNTISIIRKVFTYTLQDIASAGFSGETDAVLTCKLGEASCNGKSRLMVALLRQMGIPSRLVGGVILQRGSKRTTHQWIEAYIGDLWVPFCPLNGHFATKPRNYLAVYRGDHAYFRHTPNISFDYRFVTEPRLAPKEQGLGKAKALDIVNVWQVFQQAGVPLDLLRFVLIIPIGALVTILFRNVIGIETFGTFLPALIASAFMGTGLLWGSIIFAAIISAGAGINNLLSRLKLLHTPKLTIVMIFVVAALLIASMVGIQNGYPHLAHSFFFPLAILTITIERFFIIGQERGIRESFRILGLTMIVVAFCYMVMSSLFLQMVMVILPETYLLLLAASLYLGRWAGLRVMEWRRFRHLIWSENA